MMGGKKRGTLFLGNKLPAGVKVGLETLPSLEVVMLDLSRLLEGPVSGLELHRGLKHESLGALGNVHGLQFLGRGLGESGRIRSMRGHHRVKGGTAGNESTLLGLIGSVDQSHELGHTVTVEVRRTELMDDIHHQEMIAVSGQDQLVCVCNCAKENKTKSSDLQCSPGQTSEEGR